MVVPPENDREGTRLRVTGKGRVALISGEVLELV